MSTCNNYISATMLLGSSHTFRSDMFRIAGTVTGHTFPPFYMTIFTGTYDTYVLCMSIINWRLPSHTFVKGHSLKVLSIVYAL